MKRKIVYFLCRIGFYKIANIISPTYVSFYKTQKSFERLRKTAFNATESMRKLQLHFEVEIKNTKHDDEPNRTGCASIPINIPPLCGSVHPCCDFAKKSVAKDYIEIDEQQSQRIRKENKGAVTSEL